MSQWPSYAGTMKHPGLKIGVLSALVSLLSIPFGGPAVQAAQIADLTATTSTPLQHGQPNASSIVLSFSLPTALASTNVGYENQIIVNVNRVSASVLTGNYFSATATGVDTSGWVYTGTQANNYTQFSADFSEAIPSGTSVALTIAAGTLTMPITGDITVEVSSYDENGNQLDTGTITMTIGVASSTVTFNANGGSGTMSAQTSSSAAALTTNTFTKAGYAFGGWAISQVNASAGTVAYADGASYPFTSSTTLYAIWTANGSGGGSGGSGISGASSGNDSLATTGFDAAVPMGVAGLLVLAGAALTLIRRRHAG